MYIFFKLKTLVVNFYLFYSELRWNIRCSEFVPKTCLYILSQLRVALLEVIMFVIFFICQIFLFASLRISGI
jgi:hypothetical protein